MFIDYIDVNYVMNVFDALEYIIVSIANLQKILEIWSIV